MGSNLVDEGSVIRKFKYFLVVEAPNELDEHGNPRKTWQVVSTTRAIVSGENVTQILNDFCIRYEITPPILPLSLTFIGEELIDLSEKQTLLLYQMGKVGSVSIRSALEKLEWLETRHMHYLVNEGEYGTRYDPVWLRRLETEDTIWKVITLVRNPIDRCVSGFFWSMIGKEEPFHEGMLDMFVNEYNHNWTVNWMENELNKALNTNIYNYPFNKKRGYSLYHRTADNVRPYFHLLVIRTEDMSQVARTAIAELLPEADVGNINTLNSSIKRKPIANAYSQFKAQAVLPDDYVDWILNTRYAKHFYSDEELAVSRAMWTLPPEERLSFLKDMIEKNK